MTTGCGSDGSKPCTCASYRPRVGSACWCARHTLWIQPTLALQRVAALRRPYPIPATHPDEHRILAASAAFTTRPALVRPHRAVPFDRHLHTVHPPQRRAELRHLRIVRVDPRRLGLGLENGVRPRVQAAIAAAMSQRARDDDERDGGRWRGSRCSPTSRGRVRWHQAGAPP